MKIKQKSTTKTLAAGTILGALLLAGCQSATPVAPSSTTVTAQPTTTAQPVVGSRAALDGVWLPTNEGNVGKYTATFADGKFTTKLTGGGGVIGAGTYKIDSASQVSLVWVGEATGTKNSAKCSWQQTTMSCNSDKGFSFQLRKST